MKLYAAKRKAAYEKLGYELSGNDRYLGTAPALWPDGSWDCDFNYPALPIRSAKAIERRKPKEVAA